MADLPGSLISLLVRYSNIAVAPIQCFSKNTLTLTEMVQKLHKIVHRVDQMFTTPKQRQIIDYLHIQLRIFAESSRDLITLHKMT